MKHDSEHCPGAICVGDDTKDWQKNVIWYPGEPVCGKKPYLHGQKIQTRINRLMKKGLFKYPQRYFTWEMLQAQSRVMNGTKGKNPEQRTWDRVNNPSKKARRQKKEGLTTMFPGAIHP
jgi:hypothetical protein